MIQTVSVPIFWKHVWERVSLGIGIDDQISLRPLSVLGGGMINLCHRQDLKFSSKWEIDKVLDVLYPVSHDIISRRDSLRVISFPIDTTLGGLP